MQTLHSASHFVSSVHELPWPGCVPQLQVPLTQMCFDEQLWPLVVLPPLVAPSEVEPLPLPPPPHAPVASGTMPIPSAIIETANIRRIIGNPLGRRHGRLMG